MFTSDKGRKILIGGALAMFLALVLAPLIIRVFFIGVYRIPQNGMYPGLPAGSRIFLVRCAYASAANVKRGDIVIFVREENGHPYNFIWRVIALPGETVVASGDSLAINGQAVRRQRLREADGRTIFQEQIGNVSYEVALAPSPDSLPPEVSLTVPPDQFFVMGDNRDDARDSRFFGPIPFASIIGRKL